MIRRPTIALAALVLLAAGCATTGSTGAMRWYGQSYDEIWNAAQAAVGELGARITFANRSTGSIGARMPLPEVGGTVELDIDVRRSTTDPNLDAGADVSVIARLNGGIPEDPELAAELRRLEEMYLDLVDQLAGRGRTMRGPSRPF